MASLKSLAGDTVLYGLSSIAGRTINFLLVPLYTARFPAAEYAVVTAIYAYVAFFNVLYTFGLETAYFRFANKEGADKKLVYGQSFSIVLIISVLLSLPFLFFAGQAASFIDYQGSNQFIVWMTWTVAIDAITSIAFARLRLERKAAKFAVIKLANIFLNVGLNLFFLYGCPLILKNDGLHFFHPFINQIYDPKLGPGYVFLCNLLANGTLFLFLYREIIQVKLGLHRKMVSEMLVYAYPIMIMGLAGTINEMLGRSILEKILPLHFYPRYGNKEALGIYGACYKLSVFMALAIQSFKYAAEPFFFSQSKQKNAPETFAKIMTWFVAACLLLFLAVSLNLDWIGKLFLRRPVYLDGLNVVPILLIANMMLGIYYNLTVWFKLSDKTGYGTWISLGGAVITIVFNLLLIPEMGYLGSAIATLICYTLMALACYWLGQKYFPIPYKIWSILGMTGLAVLIFVVNQFWLTDLSLVVLIPVRAGLILGFCGVVWVMNRPGYQKKHE